MYGNPIIIIHNVHLVTCKGHIGNNKNIDQYCINHINKHKFNHYTPSIVWPMHFGVFKHTNERVYNPLIFMYTPP